MPSALNGASGTIIDACIISKPQVLVVLGEMWTRCLKCYYRDVFRATGTVAENILLGQIKV